MQCCWITGFALALVLARCATAADTGTDAAPESPPLGAFSKTITGKVVAIADGDTLTILDAEKVQHKVRLEGIDAPERRQAFGTKSREALAEKVFGKTVTVRWKERDRYKRVLGHVLLDRRWINREMVREGWAWHFERYNDMEPLAEAEEEAREERAGLWADPSPVPPWDYRRTPTPHRS